jgi:hypothetical protein
MGDTNQSYEISPDDKKPNAFDQVSSIWYVHVSGKHFASQVPQFFLRRCKMSEETQPQQPAEVKAAQDKFDQRNLAEEIHNYSPAAQDLYQDYMASLKDEGTPGNEQRSSELRHKLRSVIIGEDLIKLGERLIKNPPAQNIELLKKISIPNPRV